MAVTAPVLGTMWARPVSAQADYPTRPVKVIVPYPPGGGADTVGRIFFNKLSDAFDRVWRLAEAKGISLRLAALVSGIDEVAAALKARGIYP